MNVSYSFVLLVFQHPLFFKGDLSGSSTDAFYFPTYKVTDKQEPRTVFGPRNQKEWREKRYREERMAKQRAAPRAPHWSENTEMPQTMGTPNIDVPTAPAFTFGESERPPLSSKDPTVRNIHRFVCILCGVHPFFFNFSPLVLFLFFVPYR